MSDLAATHCGGCDNGCFGGNNCILWILILLCCGNGCGSNCGGGCGCGSSCDCILPLILILCCCGNNNGCC